MQRRCRRQRKQIVDDKNYFDDTALKSGHLEEPSHSSEEDQQKQIEHSEDILQKRESGTGFDISVSMCEPPLPQTISTSSPNKNKRKKKIQRGNSIKPLDDESNTRPSVVKVDRVQFKLLPSERPYFYSSNEKPSNLPLTNQPSVKKSHIKIKKIGSNEPLLSHRSRQPNSSNVRVMALDSSHNDVNLTKIEPSHGMIVTKINCNKSITTSHE